MQMIYTGFVCQNCRSIAGVKAKAGFKATEKSGGPMAAPIVALKKLGSNIKNSMQRTTRYEQWQMLASVFRVVGCPDMV